MTIKIRLHFMLWTVTRLNKGMRNDFYLIFLTKEMKHIPAISPISHLGSSYAHVIIVPTVSFTTATISRSNSYTYKQNYSFSTCNGFTNNRNTFLKWTYLGHKFHMSYISPPNGLSQHFHHIIPLTVSSFEAFCPAHQHSLKIFCINNDIPQ